jgi:stage III sporulation protein AE
VRRIFKFIIIFAVAFYTLPFLTFANEVEAVIPEDAWNGFREGIPEGVQGHIEGGAFENEENYFNAIEKMTAPKAIVTALLELFGAEAGTTFRLLLLIIGVLLISAVLCVVGEQSENKTLLSVIRFCSLGAIFSSAGYAFYMHFERLEEFFSQISVFINGMIPVTASIWALGGNVTTATAGSATLYCFLTVFEKLWAASAVPIFALLLMLGFCDVLCTELKSGRVLGTVKRIYGFLLGLSMTVLLSSLAAQTTLTAVADSVSARAGRLVSSTVIPIVGGNLGEALRTVASSVTYLKSIFGIGGIIIIALIVLPMAISLLLTRFAFGVSATFADIIGCEREAKLLASFSEAYGCMLAVVCGVGMMFVLSLCIFMKTIVAAA